MPIEAMKRKRKAPEFTDRILAIVLDYMELNDVTQKSLVDATGISQPHLSRFLAGNTKLGSHSLDRMAKAIGLRVKIAR